MATIVKHWTREGDPPELNVLVRESEIRQICGAIHNAANVLRQHGEHDAADRLVKSTSVIPREAITTI